MKNTIVTTAMITLLAPFAFAGETSTFVADPFAFAEGKDEKTCFEAAQIAGETIKSAIAKGENIVTLSQDAVADAIEGNPECACEIIKEAVQAAQGSTELITSIVEAALLNEAIPHEAILTCSLETAPEAAHSAIYNMVGDAATLAPVSGATSGVAGSTAGAVGAPVGAVVGGAAGSGVASANTSAAVAAAASQVAASNETQAASVAAVLIGGVAAPETAVASADTTPAMSEADPVAGQ